MKSKELHRLIQQKGWKVVRVAGSHVIYQRGNRRYPVPLHGSKEIPSGLEKKIRKEMELDK